MTEYQQIKNIIKARKAILDKLKIEIDIQDMGTTFFSKDEVVKSFKEAEQNWQELLLELRCCNNQPIENNAKVIGDVKLDLQPVLKNFDDSNPILNQHQ